VLKKKNQILVTLILLVEISIAGGCWNLAYYLRFMWIEFRIPLSIPEYKEYFNITPAIMVLTGVCFFYAKMYRPRQFNQGRVGFKYLISANLTMFILLLALSFFYRRFSFSRLHSIYFLSINIVSISLFRYLFHRTLAYLHRKGKNVRRILLIGNQHTAHRFFNKIQENKSLGLVIVGTIAPDGNSQSFNAPHLGGYDSLAEVILREKIDQVFIALDSDQQSDLKEINHKLAEQTVDLNIIPDIYSTLNINPEIFDLEGMPIITLRQSPLAGWNLVVKRLFDIIGSLIAIILFLPAWIILPIIIKLTSPGPIFYFQERMGIDGKKFNMMKFRSMKINAEDDTGAVWAKEDDPRRTRFGSFLRSSSLDEIPQFFHVLVGTMSLVGPRPERPVFIEQFKTQIPNYMVRHKMKAGITGWAQVQGWRGNTSLEKRIECDLYYLSHWSVWLDLKICILTLFKGFIHKHAY